MSAERYCSFMMVALVAACSSAQRIENDAGVDGDSDGGVDACPGTRHTRTITITNASLVVQHFNFEAPLAMEQQTSGAWQEFLPWAWCRTTCDECEPVFCEPCDPTLRALATDESQTYEWEGYTHLTGDDVECDWEGSSVACIEQLEAPAGRYRIELCHSPDYVEEEEQFGSCYGVEGYVSPASLDSPECVAVEFEYDPCEPGSVEIIIEP